MNYLKTRKTFWGGLLSATPLSVKLKTRQTYIGHARKTSPLFSCGFRLFVFLIAPPSPAHPPTNRHRGQQVIPCARNSVARCLRIQRHVAPPHTFRFSNLHHAFLLPFIRAWNHVYISNVHIQGVPQRVLNISTYPWTTRKLQMNFHTRKPLFFTSLPTRNVSVFQFP